MASVAIIVHPGEVFGRLTIKQFTPAHRNEKNEYIRSQCICDCSCGTKDFAIHPRYLKREGRPTRSCGCIPKEMKPSLKHGLKGHTLYNVWKGIRRRCYNKNCEAYKWYGERGIKVCDEWNDPAKFVKWAIEEGWTEGCGLSIERRNVNGDYSPDNCCLATQVEQMNNTRRNRFITAWKETKTIAQWSRDPRCKIDRRLLHSRVIKQGIPPELAMTTNIPPEPKRHTATAWNETKTLTEWAEDPRCLISYSYLYAQVVKKGVNPEVAMSKKTSEPPRSLITAWGESKTRAQWVEDPRCSVSNETIRTRIKEGWSPEAAISTPPGVVLTAFGETKTLANWTRDPRCNVSFDTLTSRIKAGWDPEEAITVRLRREKTFDRQASA